MARYSYTFMDFSRELSTVVIPVEEPSEVSLNWETIINANEAGMRSAIEGVTLASLQRHSVTVSEEDISDPKPTNQYAQRESGLRVFYHGVTSGEKRNLTIPAPDLTALTLQDNSDLVELEDGGAMAALVTELEANLQIQYGASTEQIEVDRALIVGRNN